MCLACTTCVRLLTHPSFTPCTGVIVSMDYHLAWSIFVLFAQRMGHSSCTFNSCTDMAASIARGTTFLPSTLAPPFHLVLPPLSLVNKDVKVCTTACACFCYSSTPLQTRASALQVPQLATQSGGSQSLRPVLSHRAASSGLCRAFPFSAPRRRKRLLASSARISALT